MTGAPPAAAIAHRISSGAFLHLAFGLEELLAKDSRVNIMADSTLAAPAGEPKPKHASGAATADGAGSAIATGNPKHDLELPIREFFAKCDAPTQRAAARTWRGDKGTPLKTFFRPAAVNCRATKWLPKGHPMHPMHLVTDRVVTIANLQKAAESMPVTTAAAAKPGKGSRGGSAHDMAEFCTIARMNGDTADVPVVSMHHAFRHVANAQARVHTYAHNALREASQDFNATLAAFYSVGTQRSDAVFTSLCALLAAHQEWRHPGEPPRLKAKLLNSAGVPDIRLMAAGLDPHGDGDERATTPLSLIELNNERGTSGNPGVQNLAYYAAEVWHDNQLRPFPMLLVSMPKAELHCFGAIVRSEAFVVELFYASTTCRPCSQDAVRLAYLYAT